MLCQWYHEATMFVRYERSHSCLTLNYLYQELSENLYSDIFPGIFQGGSKSIVMNIFIVMLILLLFWAKILGGGA